MIVPDGERLRGLIINEKHRGRCALNSQSRRNADKSEGEKERVLEKWGSERSGEKGGRRKKNRSYNGERIPLGVRETFPRENPTSDPLLSLYIRRISTNEIIKITKLRSATKDDDDDDERSCSTPGAPFPLSSPSPLPIEGRLYTHLFARG